MLGGSYVAAESPAEGHHLRRLVPGTGERCDCPWPSPEPQARPCGNRAVPNLPFPATGGTCARSGGSAPIGALGRAPTVIRLFSRASAQVPPAAEPQTCDVQGPRWPPTAGNYTESKLQPRCGESIQARPHRAADCAARSLPQRDGYPLRDPRARSITTGSRRRSRGQLPSVSAGVRRGMPPRLPGTYFQDV